MVPGTSLAMAASYAAMNSGDHGRPGRRARLKPGRRKYQRAVPCRSTNPWLYFGGFRSMNLIPLVEFLPALLGQSVKRQIERPQVPDATAVDTLRSGHPTVAHKLVKLRRGETPIYSADSTRDSPRREGGGTATFLGG